MWGRDVGSSEQGAVWGTPCAARGLGVNGLLVSLHRGASVSRLVNWHSGICAAP